jgi:integrase
MSVQQYKTADGVQWRVRWRDPDGKMRSRTTANKREALALDADVKSRKFRGEVIPRTSRDTLAAAYEQWKELYAKPYLTKKTLIRYEEAWEPHVKGRHDHHLLAEFVANPQLFDEMLAEMRERGVGNESQRKVLIVMSSVFKAAVRWQKVSTNPVLAVPKPSGTPTRIPHPFPPIVIERIRLQMLRRATRDVTGTRGLADASLVALMAYAGLRPGEALALTWADIGHRTLAIDKAVSLGEEAPTKTRRSRSVPLVEQLASDLTELREACGNPTEDKLVFPARSGGHWSKSQYNNWRNRVWNPVLKKLAESDPPQPRLAKAIPYDCRGSFISLQLRAGTSPLEVAKWAGHSPQVMFSHYANVIDELVGEPVLSATEQIERAREAVGKLETQELDKLVADLLEHPTVRYVHGGGPAILAARIFFGDGRYEGEAETFNDALRVVQARIGAEAVERTSPDVA